MKPQTKAILSSMAGNTLEFYDFYLYGTFAPLLAKIFFPTYDSTAALMASLMTFAAGYFMRPLGAILFGHLGDRLGRKQALTLSIFLMAIPTSLIGLLPTYDAVGIVAPIVLVLCRLLQSICAGGEYNGAAIFAIEHIGKGKEGFAGSLMSVSGGGGALLATFIGAFFMQSTMPHWSWRIPFLLGALLGGVGFYIRRQVHESPQFKKDVAKKPLNIPLSQALSKFPIAVLCCIGGAAFSGALSSTFAAYMNVYLTKVVGLELGSALSLNTFGLIVFVSCAPLAGMLADRFGLARVMTISTLGLMMSIYGIFNLVSTGLTLNILLANFLLCAFAVGFIAPLNAFMNRLFPANSRYSGIAFGYGVGMATLGGTTPIIMTWLIDKTGLSMAPAFYLMSLGALGLLIIFVGSKITEPQKKLEFREQLVSAQ